MTSSDGPQKPTRRDFLTQTTAAAAILATPFIPKPAIARTYATQRAPEGAQIARVGIYPAIGICRVGGSRDWFLAPEVPGLPPVPEGGFKDGTESIKKQVQRFRIYAYDDQDRIIGEITSDTPDTSIEWSVHLANTKAAWYGFNNPLDQGAAAPGLPGQMRNQYFTTDAQREANLIIDGGLKSISGASTNPDGTEAALHFEGTFWGNTKVGLGHLQSDDAGRLMVFPPDGVSASPTGAGITSFADNDGWHDDWCDGPVTANVTLPDGTVMSADPAWVACCGPNFAPEIPPITTLYDVIHDLNVQEGWTAPPETVSFRKDIYPTFRRVALMEWLTNAARHRVSWLGFDFNEPGVMQKLADPGEANKAFRQQILGYFRDPRVDGPDAFKTERLKIPYMLGDGVNYDGSPLQWFQFPKLQYDMLLAWAEGNFVNDLDDDQMDAITSLDQVPLEQQPHALTEAALEPCSGGAFHPGVELTYYLRIPEMYARATNDFAEPFRIAHGNRDSLVQNVGLLLTFDAAFHGTSETPPPIGPQMAGDLTRWMGLPWQCDAFSCQQVLLQDNYPTAVWWPALLPIDVLPEQYYGEMMKPELSGRNRVMFFNTRQAWSRGVAGIGYHANASYWDGITNMITLWERMGFVVKRPGPTDPGRPADIPDEVFVEVDRGNMEFRFDWTPSDGMLPK